MRELPATKREGLLFGTMMCFGMVFVMTFYNMWLNGVLTTVTITGLLLSFAVGFVIALSLDLFVVGPLARKAAAKVFPTKTKKIHMVLKMSTFMVFGMAACMSVYGLISVYLHGGTAGGSWLGAYMSIFLKNFIVAFPLQLLIMGPVVRYLFVKFIKEDTLPALEAE